MFLNDEKQMDIEDFDVKTASEGMYNNICDEFISEDEIKTALKSLKSGKAIGLDDIAPEFYYWITQKCY